MSEYDIAKLMSYLNKLDRVNSVVSSLKETVDNLLKDTNRKDLLLASAILETINNILVD